jgi:hypothetical protein
MKLQITPWKIGQEVWIAANYESRVNGKEIDNKNKPIKKIHRAYVFGFEGLFEDFMIEKSDCLEPHETNKMVIGTIYLVDADRWDKGIKHVAWRRLLHEVNDIFTKKEDAEDYLFFSQI